MFGYCNKYNGTKKESNKKVKKNTTSSKIEKYVSNSLNQNEIENNKRNYFLKRKKTPKTWKDSWQRPLNQSILNESDLLVGRIKTDTRNKRQNSKR
eukprot:jgi/Orpsp1_1/1179659/evm.model.c7180000070234.1